MQVASRGTEECRLVAVWSFGPRAYGILAISSILAGCGGATAGSAQSPGVLPLNGADARSVSSVSVTRNGEMARSSTVRGARSWMAPGAAGERLIYAGGDEVSYVFNPSGKVVGQIAETSNGTCSDQGGNVFFTQVQNIVEYAHGGTTPIGNYGAPGTAYSCSIDPTTGDLASVVFRLSGGDEIVVWRTPGSPLEIYRDKNLSSMLYCAYDSSGNLYVDGYNGSTFALAELPAGGTSLQDISVNINIPAADQVQWDGQYLAIETKDNTALYQLQVSGSAATLVNTVTFTGVGHRATQSWIQNGTIAIPTGPVNVRAIEIIFWRYPAGGYPIKTFKGFDESHHAMVDGVTFSNPPSQSKHSL